MPRRDAQGRDTPLRSGRGGRDGDGGDGGAGGGREGMGLILTLYDPWQIENALRGNGVWLTGIFEEPETPWFLHYCFQAGLCFVPERSRQKTDLSSFMRVLTGKSRNNKPFHSAKAYEKTLGLNLCLLRSYLRCSIKKTIRLCCS